MRSRTNSCWPDSWMSLTVNLTSCMRRIILETLLRETMTSGLQHFWQNPVTEANENECLLFSALTPSSPLFDSVMSYAELPIRPDLSHFPGVRDILSGETTRTTRTLPVSAPVPVWCASQDTPQSILKMRDGGKDTS